MMNQLLTIQEIADTLDAEFRPLEPDICGLRLVEPGLQAREIIDVERDLGVQLPESFSSIVQEFDLGSLTIGPTVFGTGSNYSELLRGVNRDSEFPWWGSGSRPSSRVMVGNSDAFAVLLDCGSGEVMALEHGADHSKAVVVARDFSVFVRGIGTVFCTRLSNQPATDVANAVASLVGSSLQGLPYWEDLAG